MLSYTSRHGSSSHSHSHSNTRNHAYATVSMSTSSSLDAPSYSHGHAQQQQQQVFRPTSKQSPSSSNSNSSHTRGSGMNIVASPTSSASSSSSSSSSGGSRNGSRTRVQSNGSSDMDTHAGEASSSSLLQVVHENDYGAEDGQAADSPATSDGARTFPATVFKQEHAQMDKRSFSPATKKLSIQTGTTETATSNNSLKSARRHSEGGMSTPVDEDGPRGIVDGAMAGTATSSSSSSNRPNQFSRSGFGFSSSSSFRQGTEDGETRPARRKVMKVDATSASASGDSSYQQAASATPASSNSISQGQSERMSESTTASRNAIQDQPISSNHEHQQSNAHPTPASQFPSMDIATYPTTSLLHLLAELLARITLANDAARQEQSQQEEQPQAGSGTVTPPATSSYTHARAASGEPVSPAVPFSTPSVAFGNQQQQSSSGYPFPEISSAYTATAAESGTSSPKPRYNFTCPKQQQQSQSSSRRRSSLSSPTKPASSSSSIGDLSHSRSSSRSTTTTTTHQQQHYAQNYTRPTILSSAAHALATPNATLCFHARNVPSISIESYLVRISKYCPTTNEVFISLLVYFDRMSHLPSLNPSPSLPALDSIPSSTATQQSQSQSFPSQQSQSQQGQSASFAVDSFNIHRLIITGITVASKFFSDVFYTNSRYAKVGGLPLPELNALELQFLLLNGFDLVVPPEELQTYADHLLRGQLPPFKDITSTSLTESEPVPVGPSHLSTSNMTSSTRGNGRDTGSGAEMGRPKSSSNRSASESSTSASEASTLMPSESSVDTERGGYGENEEDELEEAGEEDNAGLLVQEDDGQGDREMRDHDADVEDDDDDAQEDGDDPFVVPRPPRSTTRSSNGRPGRGSRANGPASEIARGQNGAPAGGSKKERNSNGQKRENSRTREWTDQQQRMQNLMVEAEVDQHSATGVAQDQDTEMAD